MSSSSSFSSIYSNASTHTQGEMENEIDESEQFEAKSRGVVAPLGRAILIGRYDFCY